MMLRPRLLPAATLAIGALILVKAETLWRGLAPNGGAAQAAATPSPAPAAPTRAPAAAAPPAAHGAAPVTPARPPAPAAPAAAIAPPPPPDPAQEAERAVLESLRTRRGEIEGREQAIAARELVLAAAERRLMQRVEEMAALQRRLEALDRTRGEREEAGWRGLVRLYETMRPRDAAAIFNDLEMNVLVQVIDRMGERKAAPVIGAMRPERARELTTELARHRAQRPEGS